MSIITELHHDVCVMGFSLEDDNFSLLRRSLMIARKTSIRQHILFFITSAECNTSCLMFSAHFSSSSFIPFVQNNLLTLMPSSTVQHEYSPLTLCLYKADSWRPNKPCYCTAESAKTTSHMAPTIISPTSMGAIIYMLRSKGLMIRLSFTMCSLTTVTKPFAQVDFLCKCQLEGQEKQ